MSKKVELLFHECLETDDEDVKVEAQGEWVFIMARNVCIKLSIRTATKILRALPNALAAARDNVAEIAGW